MKIHTLIIGYGNRLRGDDGIGPAIAEVVAAWKVHGVRSLGMHQLVPELVEELKRVNRVLFVDASAESMDGPFSVRRIEASRSSRTLGHVDSPANLLALTDRLEQRRPDAWLVEVMPSSFAFGDGLSDIAKGHVEAALGWIRAWLKEPPGSCTKSA